jgi:hypothetical protein
MNSAFSRAGNAQTFFPWISYSPDRKAWERTGARPSAPGPAMQSEQLLRRKIRLLTRLAGQIEMQRLLAEADLITQKLRSVHRRSAYFGLPTPISGAPASLYAQIKARAVPFFNFPWLDRSSEKWRATVLYRRSRGVGALCRVDGPVQRYCA